MRKTRRRIYLMRHGSVTYFDATGKPFLPESVPLNDNGRLQATAAGAVFAKLGLTFDRVVTSGLPRTVETAQRVLAETGQVIEPEVWPELQEIRGGRLSTIPDETLRDAFVGAFDGMVTEDRRFLGGESIGELLDRVLPALEKLRADASWNTVLLVLHGGVNRAILSYALTGNALTGGRYFLGNLSQAPGCINALDVGDAPTDWVVRTTNYAASDLLQPLERETTMETLYGQYLKFRGAQRAESTMYEEFIGTQPVTDRQRFDVVKLEGYLAAHVKDFAGPLTVEQFKGGQSNPTFKLTTPSRAYVMRAKPGPAAKLLPSAHAIEREYRVMHALADSGVPVARMHALCEDEDVIGRAFYVMDFVDGRVLWDQSLPGMTPAERRAIYAEMNRVIAALHNVDYAAIGLADFGKPGNYFARQIGRWSKQYKASETEHIEAMDQLIAWLPEHIPEDDGATSIVHGDYRLDNLIFHPTEPRILAILDWELSTIGHPLADFSYHLMSWHIAPSGFRGIAGLDLAALGIPSQSEYIAMYCKATGRSGIEDVDFYLAYNMFRIAGILQGIMKRVVDGTAASAQAAAAGARARTMAELGWTYAQKVGA